MGSCPHFLDAKGLVVGTIAYRQSQTRYFNLDIFYILDMQRGECSDTAGMKSLWKQIWGLNCSNKVRMFMWRACSNIFPTKHQLRARGIGRDDVCDLCGGCESSRHIL